METVFDPSTRDELLRRLDAVHSNSARQWGKMTPAQMLEHLARTLEMPTGRYPQKQILAGKLLGWVFRKQFLGEKPFAKNSPTGPDFVVRDEPALEAGREKVKSLIREVATVGEKGCDGRVHAFFGALTGAEWGVVTYKHVDHHLRQFGA